jgi:hypothetical protein
MGNMLPLPKQVKEILNKSEINNKNEQ